MSKRSAASATPEKPDAATPPATVVPPPGPEVPVVLPRVHRYTLIEMNCSVFTARRDAAHARAVQILRREVFGSTKERRTALYTNCVRLLEDAINDTQRSQIQQDTPLIHYLCLVRDTVRANLALVTHEINLSHEASEFSRLLGPKAIAEFQTAGDVFSHSEMGILHCIDGLLRFGEPLLARDTEERTAVFTDDDRRRYALARREYQTHYQHPHTPGPRK